MLGWWVLVVGLAWWQTNLECELLKVGAFLACTARACSKRDQRTSLDYLMTAAQLDI